MGDKQFDLDREVQETLWQYESDLQFPPTGDSVERRLERVRKVIANLGDQAALSWEILKAAEALADVFAHDGESSVERFDRLAEMFRRDTGYLAPGKDQPMAGSPQPDGEELRHIYDEWFTAKVVRLRIALARTGPRLNAQSDEGEKL